VRATQALAIYNHLWGWFANKTGSSVTILRADVAKKFYNTTSATPWRRRSPPTEKDLLPVTVEQLNTHLRGYAVTKVMARTKAAATQISNTIGMACQTHAALLKASTGTQPIVPTIIVPVTAVPAVVGKNGSSIAALETACGLSLHVLPIGDTVGTHSIHVPHGVVITQYQWLLISDTVKQLEQSSWCPVPMRSVAVGKTYRVRTAEGIVADGAPLLLVRLTRGQLILRDVSGVVHACPRNKQTLVVQV